MGLTLCGHWLEILNNSIFEFRFYREGPNGDWNLESHVVSSPTTSPPSLKEFLAAGSPTCSVIGPPSTPQVLDLGTEEQGAGHRVVPRYL